MSGEAWDEDDCLETFALIRYCCLLYLEEMSYQS